MPQSKSWTDFRHPEYTEKSNLWAFAQALYRGEVTLSDRVKEFLVKRTTGETEDAFLERCKLADYSNHFGALVDSLAGMMFSVEADATREFNPESGVTLGDPHENETYMGRLWDDADGDGNGWLTVWKQLATDLIHQHSAWVFVDPANGNPRIRIVDNTSVANWYHHDGVLVSAVIKEKADARTSIRDEPKSVDQFLELTTEGWARYQKDKDGNPVAVPGQEGNWAYTDPDGNPTIPMYRVSLPLKRHAGYSMARKAYIIFNKESERDHLLRTANFPKLVIHANDDLFATIVEGLKKGMNVLQAATDGNGHDYITPPTEAATIASEVLKEKVEAFWITGFKEYGEASQAREKTATESRQDVASGVGAFLQLLKSALDDAENRAFWFVEQSLWPADQTKWGHGRVERSDDFIPPDINRVIERMRERYWGKDQKVPMGRKAKIAATMQVAQWDGLPMSEEEAAAAVDVDAILQTFNAHDYLAIPEEAQVQMTLRYLTAMGLVDPEAVVDVDGKSVPILKVLEEQTRNAVGAKAEAARREAEFFPSDPRAPGGNEPDPIPEDDED